MPDFNTLDFNSLLKEAGITKVQLARKLGLSSRIVSIWGNTPPKYAEEYVLLLIQYNKLFSKVTKFFKD